MTVTLRCALFEQRRLFEQALGVAVRPDHALAQRDACRVRDLHNLRILAHGREQVPARHDELVVAARLSARYRSRGSRSSPSTP
jgi:hypothetical protein